MRILTNKVLDEDLHMSEKKYILIIDDSTTSLKHAQEMLKDTYRLAMSKSGEQGLKFLKTTKPDLILLDINMPDMDGYEMMNELKKNPDTRDIPVIFLTGEGNHESELKGFKLGAMDFITKPFIPEIVKSRIDRIIELDGLKKQLEGQVRMQSSQLESYKESSQKDGLTSLHNRNSIKQLTDEHIKQGGAGSFMMIDMDNFKSINDSFGHLVGDEVLTKFATAIKETVGEENLAGRIGGDEFVVFLKTATTREDARIIASALIANVKKQFFNSYAGDVSASIGIAMAPEDGEEFETLYSNADKSLYYVKQNGKNDYHFYSEEAVSGQDTNLRSIQVDIKQLTNIIREQAPVNGAYLIEYEGFKKIYRFLERVISRTRQNVQMVLFTVKTTEEGVSDPDKLSLAMDVLGEVVGATLRKGDVGTRYSSCQYIVILMGTDAKDGMVVTNRIIDNFNKECKFDGIKIYYDINNIELQGDNKEGENNID